MNCTIRVAKRKVLISFAVTAKLISIFVFADADCWFSNEAAQIMVIVLKARVVAMILSKCIRLRSRDPRFEPHRCQIASLSEIHKTPRSTVLASLVAPS